MPPSHIVAAALLLVLASTAPANTGDIDLHWLWEQRCFECHGPSDAFARSVLKVENGTPAGRHHRADLFRFISQHENDGAFANELHAMLLAQATSAPTYEQKCAGCHKTAAEFVRGSLATVGGLLIGKTNRKPVAEFPKAHGHLTTEEIPAVVASLVRVLSETGKSRSD